MFLMHEGSADGRTEEFVNAIWNKDNKRINNLVKVGFNPNVAVFGTTPLLEAIRLDDQPVLDLLLTKTAADPNYKNRNGLTPLVAAVSNNSVVSVKKLLAHPNIDVNRKTPGYFSPLDMACIRGNTEITKLLLEAPGIDINLSPHDGTHLSLLQPQARLYFSMECLQLLVSHGANPEIFSGEKRKLELNMEEEQRQQKQKIDHQLEEEQRQQAHKFHREVDNLEEVD